MGVHAASERGGFGLRLHCRNGHSYLNNYSGGDVVAYDTEAEAQAAANATMERQGDLCLYTKITVEPVERGAWSPSEYDSALLGLCAFAMPEAERGSIPAIQAINRARALLSNYAPEHLRRPLPLPTEK